MRGMLRSKVTTTGGNRPISLNFVLQHLQGILPIMCHVDGKGAIPFSDHALHGHDAHLIIVDYQDAGVIGCCFHRF